MPTKAPGCSAAGPDYERGLAMSTQPKTLRYRQALDAAEKQIVDALPEIIDGLIAKAKDGDSNAAAYLCDRILGKTTLAKTAPSDDREAPYSVEDFRADEEDREEKRQMQGMFNLIKARKENGVGSGA